MDWNKILQARAYRAQEEAELQQREKKDYDRARACFLASPHWIVETGERGRLEATLSITKTKAGYRGKFRRAPMRPYTVDFLSTSSFEGADVPQVLRAFIQGVRERYLTRLTDEDVESHISDIVRRYEENPYDTELFNYTETKEFQDLEKERGRLALLNETPEEAKKRIEERWGRLDLLIERTQTLAQPAKTL